MEQAGKYLACPSALDVAGQGRENTPVFVYTSYPSAELFVNGKSYGKQRKLTADESRALEGQDSLALQRRYRLMWMDVPYEPGEVKVVAYDVSGNPAEEKVIRTAGKPHHLELVADRTHLSADGKDLAYITVRVVDKDGNLCPADSRMVNFSVKGAGNIALLPMEMLPASICSICPRCRLSAVS